ncbi:hypothetical protein TNCT_234281 [Trichonephila clavata]|uniref:Uncharacterized protein n=1 Tax=Trichonephila clavata TaxID=2740835 RepID=A0A8X6J195_TRICU|nr:hypothetical protein TNCT_154841 [Trichonephila clavata]GFR32719.1 hypothetical protein TNCT_234281 [Trichonephila clavata]
MHRKGSSTLETQRKPCGPSKRAKARPPESSPALRASRSLQRADLDPRGRPGTTKSAPRVEPGAPFPNFRSVSRSRRDFSLQGRREVLFFRFRDRPKHIQRRAGTSTFFSKTPREVPRATPGSKKINSRGFAPRERNAKKPDRGRCDRLCVPKGHSFDAAPPGPRARVFLFRVFPKVVEIRQKCTFSPPGEARSFPNKDGTARGIFPEIRDPVDPDEGSTDSKSEGRNSRKFRGPGLPKATSGPAFEKARPRGARLRKRQRRRPVEGPAGDNFRVGPRTSVREPGPPECFRGPALRRGRFRGRDRKRRVFEFVSTGPTRKYESEFAKAQVSVSEAEECRTQNSISTPRTKLSRDTTFLRRDQSPYTLRSPEELVETKRNGCGF